MSSIQPLSLPDAAGLEFAGGDVRHFSPNDGISVPALANPTRQLAHRDNELAAKVNEVVAVVNNKEQFINLPTFRTSLPPTRSEVVTNFRIPPGMEARIFNAIVSSSPADSAEIEIFHNAGSYGGTTGTSIVKTKTEFSNGQEFREAGEFVVKLTNTSSASAEVVASAIITMRPVGQLPGTPLIAAVIQGKPGKRGPAGPPGERGPAGPVGPSQPGAKGIRWRGDYVADTAYLADDAVHDPLDGSSYISTVDNPTLGAHPSTNLAQWDLFAAAGKDGSVSGGLQYGKTAGDPVGDYTPGTSYLAGAFVTHKSSNEIIRTYYTPVDITNTATQTPSLGPDELLPNPPWVELFGPSPLPSYGSKTIYATVSRVAGFVATSAHARGNVISHSAGTAIVTLQQNGTYPLVVGGSYGQISAQDGTGYKLRIYKAGGGTVLREVLDHPEITAGADCAFTLDSNPGDDISPGDIYELLEPRMPSTPSTTGINDYLEIPSAYTNPDAVAIPSFELKEVFIEGPNSGTRGFALLYGVLRVSLRGRVEVTLPNTAGGAKIDWQTAFTHVNCANNSSIVVQNTSAGAKVFLPQVFVNASDPSLRKFFLDNSLADFPQHFSVFVLGSAPIQS